MRDYGITNAAPYATAPAVGAAGDTYFNTTSKTLFLSDGTQWIQVQAGGAAASYMFAQGANAPQQPFTSQTWNQVAWSQVYANNTSLGSGNTGVAGGAVNFTQAGKYLALANIAFWAPSNAVTVVQFRYNLYSSGGALKQQRDTTTGSTTAAGYNFFGQASITLDVAAGDYLQIYVFPNAANISLDSSGTKSWLNIVPVGGTKGDKGDPGATAVNAPRLLGYISNAGNWGTVGPAQGDIAGSQINVMAMRSGCVARFQAMVPIIKSGADGTVYLEACTSAGGVFHSTGLALPNGYSSVMHIDIFVTGLGATAYKLRIGCNVGTVAFQPGTGTCYTFSVIEYPINIPT